MRIAVGPFLFSVLMLLAMATPSQAQSAPSAPPAAEAGRRPPAFRGRQRVGIEASDVVLFVPRVVLAPLWLISEYVIRRPAVALTAFIEAHNAPVWALSIFHPIPNISWSPAFDLVLGYVPLFGANVTVDNVALHGNQVRVRGLFGANSFDLAVQDRITVGPVRLGLRESLLDRPDFTFYGIGPTSSRHGEPRYHLRRRDASAFVQFRPSHHFWFDVTASYRLDDTGPGLGDSVTRHFDPQDPSMLPGFGSLSLVIGQAALVLDSRPRPEVRSGVRFEATALAAADTERADTRFGVATAELQGAVEVMHPGRVLVGSVYVADSEAFGTAPVPFTYLPTLGGTRHVGFVPGRFTGPSAVLAEVRYLYPIWVHLDAIWQASVGNVYGEHFAGFDPRLLTGSVGVGIRSVLPDRDALEAIVALGSNRFDQPFGIDGVRVGLSLNRGL